MRRNAWISLGAGGAGLVACGAGWDVDRLQFYRSWLWAFLFWAGLGVGSAGVAMLHHLVGGGWGAAVRRPLEAGAGTAFVLPLLFLPLLGFYPSEGFFLGRAGLYFAVWMLGAWMLRRSALNEDRRRRLSAIGLLAFAFTLSFAAVDWAMSLEPGWSSSIYGLLFIGGQLLSAFAAAALWASVKPDISARSRHDVGNLLFMAVLLWAYLSFSQILIVWSGNLPEESAWLLRRTRGGWGSLAGGLALFGFALPFLLLLRQDVKRSPLALAAVALVVLLSRLADTFWWVAPAFFPDGLRLHWLDFAAPVAVGGLWLAAWFFFHSRSAAHA